MQYPQKMTAAAVAALLVRPAVAEMSPEGESVLSGVLCSASLESLTSANHSSRLENQLGKKAPDTRFGMTRVHQRMGAQCIGHEGAVLGFLQYCKDLMIERALQEAQTRWTLLHTEAVAATFLIPR